MAADPEDPSPEAKRLPRGRVARTARVGGLVTGQGARWAELWTRLAELPDRTAAINLDRADVLAGALADIARTKALR